MVNISRSQQAYFMKTLTTHERHIKKCSKLIKCIHPFSSIHFPKLSHVHSRKVSHVHSCKVSHVHSCKVSHVHSRKVSHVHSCKVSHVHSRKVSHVHSQKVSHAHSIIHTYVIKGKHKRYPSINPGNQIMTCHSSSSQSAIALLQECQFSNIYNN